MCLLESTRCLVGTQGRARTMDRYWPAFLPVPVSRLQVFFCGARDFLQLLTKFQQILTRGHELLARKAIRSDHQELSRIQDRPLHLRPVKNVPSNLKLRWIAPVLGANACSKKNRTCHGFGVGVGPCLTTRWTTRWTRQWWGPLNSSPRKRRHWTEAASPESCFGNISISHINQMLVWSCMQYKMPMPIMPYEMLYHAVAHWMTAPKSTWYATLLCWQLSPIRNKIAV